ncbi:TPA: hypothetical protein ACTXF0_003721 [Klebsiella pneumoniae]
MDSKASLWIALSALALSAFLSFKVMTLEHKVAHTKQYIEIQLTAHDVKNNSIEFLRGH